MSDFGSDIDYDLFLVPDTYTETDEEISEAEEWQENSTPAAEDVVVLTRYLGSIKVLLIKGVIENQASDVIVNATSSSLDLQKAVASKALAEKGGPEIQEDLRKNYNNGIKEGDIAKSISGSLECEEVYHITMEKRQHGGSKVVERYVTKCLNEANSSGYSTLAFPALGTGKLKYNKYKVAEAMFYAVEVFAQKNPHGSVTSVSFVIHPSEARTMEAFQSASKQSSEKEIKPNTSHRTVNTLAIDELTVELVVGSLHEQQTDVIFATATRGLDLSKGPLSKSVLKAAGTELQDECKSKYPEGIQHGQIAELGPGKSNFKKILFGAIARHGEGPIEVLTNVVAKSLEICSSDGLNSISFPTIGTGNLRYPPSDASRFILSTIVQFLDENPSTTVKKITIVIHHDSTSVLKNIEAPFDMAFQARANPTSFCKYMYSRAVISPANWTYFTSDKTVKDWKICATDAEMMTMVDVDQVTFDAVADLVQATWDKDKVGRGNDAKGLAKLKFTKLSVKRVQRIENLNLLETYGNKCQELFHLASQGDGCLDDATYLSHGHVRTSDHLNICWKPRVYGEINEVYLFHGTKQEQIDGVCTQGLDARLGSGKAVYGQAIYMAESSTKADQYTDPKTDRRSSDLQMFLVRACLGRMCQRTDCQHMKRPPCLDDTCEKDDCAHIDRYHSIVEEDRFIFREFVVYEGSQVYPEYLITYDRI